MDQKQDENIEQPQREWVTPELRRMRAGDAEVSGSVFPDGVGAQMS